MSVNDSAGEFRRFQGSANISIYQLLEMELLRVGNREVGIRDLTSTAPFSSHWSWQQWQEIVLYGHRRGRLAAPHTTARQDSILRKDNK